MWLDPLFACPLAGLPCQAPASEHCGAGGCSRFPWPRAPALGGVSTRLGGEPGARLLPQCWHGAAVRVSGVFQPGPGRCLAQEQSPPAQPCQNASVCQAPLWVPCRLLLRCAEEGRESNHVSSLQLPEKFVVIHCIDFSVVRSVEVHPFASPEDTVLPLLLSKIFQCLWRFS